MKTKKTKLLITLAVVVAAIVLGGCTNPNEVVIIKGERISAPRNVRVSGQNDPSIGSVMVYFTPATSATGYRYFASNTTDRKVIYEVSPGSNTPSWSIDYENGENSYLMIDLPKSSFATGAFWNPAGTQGLTSIWMLGNLRYVGVANFSYHSTNIPSDITWVNVNSSAGTGYPGYDGGGYPGGVVDQPKVP